LNLNTLESRLCSLIKRSSTNSHNQRHPQLVNSSSSIGTMIPTPGMSNSGNSNMMTSSVDTMMITSSGCDTIAPPAVNTGSLLPSSGMHGSSFSRSDGNFKPCVPLIFPVNDQFIYFVTMSHNLCLQEICLMDTSSHQPIFPLVLVETCHLWACQE